MLLLALARHRPDMDELVPDLKRLDRTHGSKLLKRLGQILLEFPHLLGPATAEFVQVGHSQRVGRGVAGIKPCSHNARGLLRSRWRCSQSICVHCVRP